MANDIQHTELTTTDVKAAKKFYKSIFPDWSFTDTPMGPGMTYTLIADGKKGMGGITLPMMPGVPTAWLPYVTVADVKKTVAKAAKAGGKIHLAFQDIGPNGTIGVIADPQGAAIGVWAPAPKKPAAKKKAKKK